MIWAGSGISSERDPVRAAEEAARAAMARAGLQRAGLVLLFSTSDHSAKYAEMLRAVRQATGSGNLVGCSGAGVLTSEGEIEGERGVAVMALAADRATAAPFLVQNLRGRDREAGHEIARLVEPYRTGGSMLAIFPDTLNCNPEALFQGVNERLGPIQVVGAGAADCGGGDVTFQMCGGRVITNGVAGVLLSGELTCSLGVTQSCRPIGRAVEVTAAEGNVIESLDGRPPLEALAEAVGEHLERDLERLAGHVFVGFPTQPVRAGEPFRRGTYFVRNIIGVDSESGAVAIGRRISTGDVISFVLRDPLGAREDLKAMLDEECLAGSLGVPRLGLYFNCCARGSSLYGLPGIDTAFIGRAFESLPMAGFFSFFEFATMGGEPQLHNYTGVMTLISEQPEGSGSEVTQ
ncbi:MAG TPA: FIST N-terminal domain-containing protein [Candidatus Saccharimonadales bacterium]|nr:FIST N-terminal domain-containing protein [Candidatus Saccharimonadales bacterium]